MATNGWKDQLETWIRQACLMEVMCSKPGNVGPATPFAPTRTEQATPPDQFSAPMTAADFIHSADAIAQPMAAVTPGTVGATVLRCIQQTRRVVSHNTNLGIVLLLTPLAAVPPGQSLKDGIAAILQGLTLEDSEYVYAAIRLARPGGLGTAAQEDVRNAPQLDLRACMQLAADRDLIAAQYANGFQHVLNDGLQLLNDSRQVTSDLQQQIVWTALQLLAHFGDSLILRKCGPEIVETARRMAQDAISSGWPNTDAGRRQYECLDQYLRADGHQRNPGTTADMIAAILFSAMRDLSLMPTGTWWLPAQN